MRVTRKGAATMHDVDQIIHTSGGGIRIGSYDDGEYAAVTLAIGGVEVDLDFHAAQQLVGAVAVRAGALDTPGGCATVS